jgi:hypothetical protein
MQAQKKINKKNSHHPKTFPLPFALQLPLPLSLTDYPCTDVYLLPLFPSQWFCTAQGRQAGELARHGRSLAMPAVGAYEQLTQLLRLYFRSRNSRLTQRARMFLLEKTSR